MTFIIALGVIIILLCSASVFKLITPKPADSPKRHRHKKVRQPRRVQKTAAKQVVSQKADEQKPAMKKVLPEKPVVAPVVVPEIISLHLYAENDKPYAGYEFLQALLSSGLRFGAMNIFHRHEKKTGAGPILFSLASSTKEGVFDLAKIGSFSCHGLILFMKPADLDNPVKVYELMLQTADELVSDLKGRVLNDQRQLLNKADVIKTHQLLSQYMENRSTMDLF